MKNITLLSGHYLQSKRKAGFHWLAYALNKLGNDVSFVTCPLSFFSIFKNDHKLQYGIFRNKNTFQTIERGLESYAYFSFLHPIHCRHNLLNSLSTPVFKKYGKKLPQNLDEKIKKSDIVFFESNQSLLLFETVKEINPDIKCVYRVSDDVRLIRYHPLVRQTEDRIISKFDIVSVSNTYLYERMKSMSVQINLRLDFHGIRKDLFDKDYPNPYTTKNNAVYVGVGEFDYDFINQAYKLFPEINFHIIGPIPNLPKAPNIISYGEIPFTETIPYLKYADIGLQIRSQDKNLSQSLCDSLKVIQYEYCKLPIIAPEVMRNSHRKSMFYYNTNKESSVYRCINQAMQFPRHTIPVSKIKSWDEIAIDILNCIVSAKHS